MKGVLSGIECGNEGNTMKKRIIENPSGGRA
jgi:hypothetical protein